MNQWLDTQTEALLQKSPPEKLAPPFAECFGLVLLSQNVHGAELQIRAIRRILKATDTEARQLLRRPLPIVVAQGLSYVDALIGQFELISCNEISVFIADEVLAEATPEYLSQLYKRLLESDEFQDVVLRIESLPASEAADRFCDQFLGDCEHEFPLEHCVLRKKARIMQHWAEKIGGVVSSSEE